MTSQLSEIRMDTAVSMRTRSFREKADAGRQSLWFLRLTGRPCFDPNFFKRQKNPKHANAESFRTSTRPVNIHSTRCLNLCHFHLICMFLCRYFLSSVCSRAEIFFSSLAVPLMADIEHSRHHGHRHGRGHATKGALFFRRLFVDKSNM